MASNSWNVPSPKTFREILNWLRVFAAPYKRAYIGTCFLGPIAGLAESVGLGVIIFLVFSIASGDPTVPADGVIGDLFRLLSQLAKQSYTAIILIIIGIVLLRAAINYLYVYATQYLMLNVERDIKSALFDTYLRLDYEQFTNKRKGKIINNIEVEAYSVGEFLYLTSRIIATLFSLSIIFFIIIATSWQVALISVFGSLLYMLFMRLVNSIARNLGQRAVVEKENLAEHVNSSMHGFKAVKISNAEQQQSERLSLITHAYSNVMFKLAKVQSLVSPVSELSLFAVIGVVCVVSIYSGNEPATTIAILALLYRARPSVRELENNLVTVNTQVASVSAIAEDLSGYEGPIALFRNSNEQVKKWRPASIKFEDVSYHYKGSTTKAVDGVTFKIAPGSTVALLGRSGAGKTTLINLLLKLLTPTSGAIRVGKEDLARIERHRWLNIAGASGQDIELLDGTLRDNLCLGLSKVGDEEIDTALELSGSTGFVQSLPDGLDSHVGADGMRFSGGQRQRLVLARALLRQPEILILDEATNAVDSLSEIEIIANIRKAMPDLTLLVIAHRGSAASDADHVILMDEGRIVEQGSPQDLSKQKGTLFQKIMKHSSLSMDDMRQD
jgi:subfamily B ATP-binding cassette protein MsbA